MRAKRVFIGKIFLNDEVDVTDPCYDDDVYCRARLDCKRGEYYAYVTMKDCGAWGERVAKIGIYKDDKKQRCDVLKSRVGVDAGLCGFFPNKPNFTDSEWDDICNKLGGKDWLEYADGIFSSSGYGDGMYDVYSNGDNSAFEIRFI